MIIQPKAITNGVGSVLTMRLNKNEPSTRQKKQINHDSLLHCHYESIRVMKCETESIEALYVCLREFQLSG